jgi:hypothetical protein
MRKGFTGYKQQRHAHFLAIKDIVVTEEFADAEAFVEPAVLVGFCKEPRRVHEIFACSESRSIDVIDRFGVVSTQVLVRTLEEFGDFLIPQRDVSFVVVDDGPQLCIATEVGHEVAHTFDALS